VPWSGVDTIKFRYESMRVFYFMGVETLRPYLSRPVHMNHYNPSLLDLLSIHAVLLHVRSMDAQLSSRYVLSTITPHFTTPHYSTCHSIKAYN
jgi:hypothetical protein